MFSNETKNLKLPQYLASDNANWDIDTNYAYQQIDDFSEKVQENQNDTDTRIDNNTGRIDALEDRCTTIEDTNVSQSEKITENENDIESLKTLTSKQSRDITALQHSDDTINNAIASAESEIGELQGNMQLINANLNETVDTAQVNAYGIIKQLIGQHFPPDYILNNSHSTWRIPTISASYSTSGDILTVIVDTHVTSNEDWLIINIHNGLKACDYGELKTMNAGTMFATIFGDVNIDPSKLSFSKTVVNGHYGLSVTIDGSTLPETMALGFALIGCRANPVCIKEG